MEDLIKKEISKHYNLEVVSIELIRDFIGTLYHVKTHDKEYAFKLYQEDTNIDVISIVKILDYLQDFDIHISKIYNTINKELIIDIKGRCGYLMKYIKGYEVDKDRDKDLILNTYRNISSAMKDYQGKIPHLGYGFYVERYLRYLKSIQYDQERIKELEHIGQSLFNQVSQLEKGFMHGDFHTGNMILSEEKQLYILDFDACSGLSSYIDLVIIFDQTNFNHYKEEDVYKTKKTFKSNKRFTSYGLEMLDGLYSITSL